MNIPDILSTPDKTEIPSFRARVSHIFPAQEAISKKDKKVKWQQFLVQDESGEILCTKWGTIPKEFLGQEVTISKSIRQDSEGKYQSFKKLVNCQVDLFVPPIQSQNLRSKAISQAINFYGQAKSRKIAPLSTKDVLFVASIFNDFSLSGKSPAMFSLNVPRMSNIKVAKRETLAEISAFAESKLIHESIIKKKVSLFKKKNLSDLTQEEADKFLQSLRKEYPEEEKSNG